MKLQLNEMDVLILKTGMYYRKFYMKEIKQFLKSANYEGTVSYSYVYARVQRLMELGLIEKSNNKPLILRIKGEIYNSVVNFVNSYAILEEQLCSKK